MGSLHFPVTIPEHRKLLEAYANGGNGEAVRVFRELFPGIVHDGFVEACTRQVIGSAWEFAKPLPPGARCRRIKQ